MDELQQSVSVYDTEHYPHGDLTERIIGIFYDVYNTLGYGFLERVYQNAMMIRLRKAGFSVLVQHPIHVHFNESARPTITAASPICTQITLIPRISADPIHENKQNQRASASPN